MTTKEFLIKSSYDDAGMSKFKKDCDSAMQAANELKLGLSSAAKIIDQNVSQSMNAAGERIRTVTSLISDQGRIAKVAFTDLSDGTRKVSGSFQSFGSTTSQLDKHIGSLVSRALLTLPVWEAMRAGLKGIEEVFQSSIHFAIEWETQMARIQIVADVNKDKLNQLSSELLNLAEKFGVSSKEVGETANEWLRMGATIDTVIPLLQETSKFSIISGSSMEEAAKRINVWRSAFKMSAEDVSNAINKLIGVQSNLGVSVEVLSDGIDKSGVKAAQMGTSFEQLVGYIAAVNQVSRQTGEAIGTQLNMAFNRMGTNAVQLAQNLSGVPFYLDATGKATTIVSSQLRGTDDILMGLAQSWNHLSNTQQNALAKTLGSARQVTTFIALMENYNNAIKATSTAAGDAQSDVNTVLDTTQRKITQVQAAWDKFINSQSITTGMKSALDTIRGALDGLVVKLQDAQRIHERFFLQMSLVSNPKQAKDLGIDVWKPITDEHNKAALDKILDARKTAERELKKSTNTSANISSSQQTNVQSLTTEFDIKGQISNIDEKGKLNRQDELSILNQQLALYNSIATIDGKFITSDGKDLSAQQQTLQSKKEQLEVAREIARLNENNTIIQAQMKADGASELQLAIQKLAYLQQIHATTEEISKQQTIVQTAGISEYKNIQDQILNTLVSEQKTLGETNLQQIQNRISLEDQLGIHLQGVDLLKQQLDLYKAITDESKKTPQERQKELQDLIKKTPGPERTGVGTSFRNERNEQRLTQEALKRGISQDTIDSILHPNLKSGTGGVNSLQDELKISLSDPLGSNIQKLANIISRLADAIERPNVVPNLTSNQRYVAPGGPITTSQGAHNGVPSYAVPFKGKDVTVDLGGVNVTVHAHTKKELKDELTKNMQELISAHIIQPNSKMNKAIKDVIEKF